MILGTTGINEAYRTGRGKIRVRAITNIEPMQNGKNRIVVTELPYMVNKARLIEKIAELVRDKKIDGITDLRDESDRQGMRICIELSRDVNPNVVLNLLYKHTQMQDTFGVIMLALVDNQPKVLNLQEMLGYYLDHQKDVVTRRTKYDLNKAEERAHILEGLLIALDNIDEVINFVPELSIEENEETMLREIKNVKTGQVTYAVRDTVIDDKEIKKDDFMGIGDQGIVAVGTDMVKVTRDMIAELVDEDSELISVYYGCDVAEDAAEALRADLEDAYPACDIELQYGGQPIYYYTVSVE